MNRNKFQLRTHISLLFISCNLFFSAGCASYVVNQADITRNKQPLMNIGEAKMNIKHGIQTSRVFIVLYQDGEFKNIQVSNEGFSFMLNYSE